MGFVGLQVGCVPKGTHTVAGYGLLCRAALFGAGFDGGFVAFLFAAEGFVGEEGGGDFGLEPVLDLDEGAAAGGFVAGVQLAFGEVVVESDSGGVAVEADASVYVLLFDFEGFGVAFGAVGGLVALVAGFAALSGAQGGQGGVDALEAGFDAAVAAAFPIVADFDGVLVFAAEFEADDAASAVAPGAVFDAASEVAFVVVSEGYQLEAAACDGEHAFDVVAFGGGVAFGSGGCGGGCGGEGAEDEGEEGFFHVAFSFGLGWVGFNFVEAVLSDGLLCFEAV